MPLDCGVTILDGRYVIREHLGDGGFAHVWRADELDQGRVIRWVAIKEVCRAEHTRDDFAVLTRRLSREALIGQSLRHPNIAQVYEIHSLNDDLALIMQYVDGGTLKQLLQLTGPLRWEETRDVALQLCHALSEVHQHELSIVHRDIKPSNILLTKSRRPMLSDFTHAQTGTTTAGRGERRLGTADTHPGTVNYSSPEHEDSHAYLTPATDIYSLALVIGEMLTGTQIKPRLRRGQPLSSLLTGQPSWLVSALECALQEDPWDRFQTADELAKALSRMRIWQLQSIVNAFRKLQVATGLSSEPTRYSVPRSEISEVRVPQVRHLDRMILIPGGDFIFGSSTAEMEHWERLGYSLVDLEIAPQRRIELPPYHIDPTLVTNQEYKLFVDETGHRAPYGDGELAHRYSWDRKTKAPPPGLEDHPVVLVSFDDATEFARWAGKRIPSEEEWEKAARGRDGRRYPWGMAWDRFRCNNAEWWAQKPLTSYEDWLQWQLGLVRWLRKNTSPLTTAVGSFPSGASTYGVLDLTGNVWEWTLTSPERRLRVLRGGSWLESACGVRNTSRVFEKEYARNMLIGFRCVADVPGLRQPVHSP